MSVDVRTMRRVVLAGAVAVSLGLSSVGVAGPALAAVEDAPARTWGIGPALATPSTAENPRVLAILPVGDRIFVGGTFDQVLDPAGVSYPVKNLAVFSATTGAADLTFGARTDGTVTTLATDGVRLFLGGSFTQVNGAARRGLASVALASGALDSWSPTTTGGQVDALAVGTSSVYAGGNFDAVLGATGTSQPFVAKISATSGDVDAQWSAAPNDRVRALNVAGDGSGRLFLGGDFTTVSAAGGTNKLAAVALSGAGAVDTSFRAGPTNGTTYAPVLDVVSDASRVYTASAGSGGACASLSSATGSVVWSAHSNGNMQSVRLLDGLLYCAGHYGGTGSFMDSDRNKLAAVTADTGALTGFAPNINSAEGPWSMAAASGRVYIGGDFSRVSGVDQPHFAMFVDTSRHSVPQPPRQLVAHRGDTAATLSWAPPSSDGGAPVQKYRVYRSTTPGGQNLAKAPLVTLSKDARAYTDTAVVNGTTYYYVVTATNVMGASPPSNGASAMPSAAAVLTPPTAPTSVTATSPRGTNHIAWNPPASNGGSPVSGYCVHRGTAPGGEKATVGCVATTSFDDLFGLTSGTTYYYVVTAQNQIGDSAASSEVSVTTTLGTPGPPTLTASPKPGPSVALSWSIPPDGGSDITKYVVLRDGVRLVTLKATADGGPTSYTDVTVAPGTAYTYQVRAANVAGNGQLSKAVSVTTA